MKILLLTSRIIYPVKDGYCIAVDSISNGLVKSGNEVRIMSVNTKRHNVNLKDINNDFINTFNPVSVNVDTDVKPIPAFFNLFTDKSYNIVRFISEDFKNKLIELLSENDFDIIQFESLFLAPYIDTVRRYSKAKTILRAHNVESVIWNRRYNGEKNPFKKWYLGVLAKRFRKYEKYIINEFDGIAAISEVDKQILEGLGCKVPMITLPIGINIDKQNHETEKPEKNSIFFIGSLDWIPNIEGLFWFLDNVWNLINKKYPNLKFYIAGRNSGSIASRINYPNVKFLGEIEDSHKFINSKEIMVVPLKYASGTRVKILEAMALGKIIITSSIGVEGINATHEENIFIANTPEEFFMVIDKYLNDEATKKKISGNAVKFVEENYDNEKIIDRLNLFYHKLLNE
ncbi:MAG: glycosyltransferase [Ignavibacteriae bacterium]|nr:glycosyltransferase [Ignavibacteriota bacterium]